ncbi:MAG: cation:proton antiporter regulatory subunit, partial [bacterium]
VRVHQRRHEAMMLAAGATEVIQPEVEAGLTLVRHSLDHIGVDRAAGRQYLAGIRSLWPGTVQGELIPESLQMQDLVVRNTEIAGRSLRWLRVRERTGATIVSIVRATGEEVLNPGPDETLTTGDRLLAIGSPDQLQMLQHLFQPDLEPDEPEG